MDDLESKMGAILGNPEAMQKIMALAQSLNQNSKDPPKEQQQKQETPKQNQELSGLLPAGIDLSMIQRLSGFAKQSGIDKNEQTLLKALGPYLSRERIAKLEKAMRAAKMARMATSLLGASASYSSTGR